MALLYIVDYSNDNIFSFLFMLLPLRLFDIVIINLCNLYAWTILALFSSKTSESYYYK